MPVGFELQRSIAIASYFLDYLTSFLLLSAIGIQTAGAQNMFLYYELTCDKSM